MERSPELLEQPAPDELPLCRNCCNASKSPKRLGYVICRALPPVPVTIADSGGMQLIQPMYPELPADVLGCGALWNVQAGLVHGLLAQLLQLQGEPGGQTGDRPDGDQADPSKGAEGTGKRAG